MGFHAVAVVGELVQKWERDSYIHKRTSAQNITKTQNTQNRKHIQNKKNIPRILKYSSRVIGK